VLFTTPEVLLWLPAAAALVIHSSKVRLKNSGVFLIGMSTILLLHHVIANHSRGYHFMWTSAGLSAEALISGQVSRSLCFLYCWIWHLVLACWVFVVAITLFCGRSVIVLRRHQIRTEKGAEIKQSDQT